MVKLNGVKSDILGTLVNTVTVSFTVMKDKTKKITTLIVSLLCFYEVL